VEHRNHDDEFVRFLEVDGVWERVQKRPSNVVADCGELARPFADLREGPIQIGEEARGKSWPLSVVPLRGRLDIRLGERPNDERAGHHRSVTAVQLSSESFLNDLPAFTCAWIGVELLQAIIDDLPVPIWNRNRIGRSRDSVPKRLQVVDLLIDRQIVESGRWKRNGVGHVEVQDWLTPV
jgi:hypothetical protein